MPLVLRRIPPPSRLEMASVTAGAHEVSALLQQFQIRIKFQVRVHSDPDPDPDPSSGLDGAV